MERAIVSEITGFSTHDGPGIRTSVFVKGCPLRCAWCSNPETWTKERLLYFHQARCLGCGTCMAACPHEAISVVGGKACVDRDACERSFACTNVCLRNALTVSGEEMTTDELFKIVLRDKPFYGKHGGLTLSGGEPLSSPKFAAELFARCKEEGVSTVLDTTGFARKEDLSVVLAYTDMVMLDLKHMDSEEHKRLTGVPNETILHNAETIMGSVETRISLPLIGDANADDENIVATAEFARHGGVKWVDINPLHSFGAAKYAGLGMESPYDNLRIPTDEEVRHVRKLFAEHGLQTTVGRMM